MPRKRPDNDSDHAKCAGVLFVKKLVTAEWLTCVQVSVFDQELNSLIIQDIVLVC